MVEPDSASICSSVLQDAIALAQACFEFGCAAQVFECLVRHAKAHSLLRGAPVKVQFGELDQSFGSQRQFDVDSLRLDPRSCSGPGLKLCPYCCRFSWPVHQACPNCWDIPMGTAKLQRIFMFCMGAESMLIEQGRHLRLPGHSLICRLCQTVALGGERHMLLECSALSALRAGFSTLISDCSGVMARLMWSKDQLLVSAQDCVSGIGRSRLEPIQHHAWAGQP